MAIEITDEMIDAYMDGVDGGAWRALDARSSDPFRGWVRGGLAAVAPLMVAAERDACAQVADLFADENMSMATDSIINDPLLKRNRTKSKEPMTMADWALTDRCKIDGTVHSSMFHAAQNIAQAIRARGDRP